MWKEASCSVQNIIYVCLFRNVVITSDLVKSLSRKQRITTIEEFVTLEEDTIFSSTIRP